MYKNKFLLSSIVALTLVAQSAHAEQTQKVGDLEVVAAINIRPGNVSVSDDGRVFATVHPLDTPSRWRLIEITGKNSYKAWPNESWQKNEGADPANQIDTPLGITRDAKNRLWIVDMGLNIGKTRIFGFDIATGKHLMTLELPESVAPRGSFIQDLVVDADGGWIYLADISNPGLITVNIEKQTATRFSGHPSLQSEKAAVMHIDGQDTQFDGKAASVGADPITLSPDHKTVFFGAMNGNSWYQVDAALLQQGNNQRIATSIKLVGPKPISDGAAISAAGTHYFTNLNNNEIDYINPQGKLVPLVKSTLLDWPDGIQFGDKNWLYISANQLHRTGMFTGKGDKGEAPYRILRVWTNEQGPVTSK